MGPNLKSFTVSIWIAIAVAMAHAEQEEDYYFTAMLIRQRENSISDIRSRQKHPQTYDRATNPHADFDMPDFDRGTASVSVLWQRPTSQERTLFMFIPFKPDDLMGLEESTDWEFMKKTCHNVVYQFDDLQVKARMLSINSQDELNFLRLHANSYVATYRRLYGDPILPTRRDPEGKGKVRMDRIVLLGAASRGKWMDRSNTTFIKAKAARDGILSAFADIQPGDCLYYISAALGKYASLFDQFAVMPCKGPKDFPRSDRFATHGFVVCKAITSESLIGLANLPLLNGFFERPDDIAKSSFELMLEKFEENSMRRDMADMMKNDTRPKMPSKVQPKKSEELKNPAKPKASRRPRKQNAVPRKATTSKPRAANRGPTSLKTPLYSLLLTSTVGFLFTVTYAI